MVKYNFTLVILVTIYWVEIDGHVLDYDDQKTWGDNCVNGEFQSPIDFPSRTEMTYSNNIFKITQVEYIPISNEYLSVFHDYKYMINTIDTHSFLYIEYNGIRYKYDLVDIHFHFNSEHTIQSKPSEIEMHMVHKKSSQYTEDHYIDPDAKHQYLVIGIMFKAEDVHDDFFISQLHFDTKKPIKHVDLGGFVDTYKPYYYYQGSLTTPNCDEAVHWVVMRHIEKISLKQNESIVNWIKANYNIGNARNTLPINGRTIYYVEPKKRLRSKYSTSNQVNLYQKIRLLQYLFNNSS